MNHYLVSHNRPVPGTISIVKQFVVMNSMLFSLKPRKRVFYGFNPGIPDQPDTLIHLPCQTIV